MYDTAPGLATAESLAVPDSATSSGPGSHVKGRAPAPPLPRLVATDLDGTLLRGDCTISPRTLAALRRTTGLGIHHVVVTGRPASGCAPFFDALDYTGLAVCGQGTQIYDAGRRRLLSDAGLDPALARTALSRLTSLVGPTDLAVVTSGADGEFVITEGFGRGDERALAPYRLATPEQLWDQPVDKVLLRHRTLSDTELTEAAARCAGSGLTVTHAGPRIVELLPSGFDKATGLAQVARALGVPARDVTAFGDMPNDIPLLTWAGHAVAMANGHPELKAVADEIAPANDDDGVAAVLERILGNAEPVPDQGVRP
ncbi:Cof-type HAD-IIB family hydrolase (plasmid) [Streptomyces sp. NBC_00868]|uniref:HAD family hydrolase n=1 Tax=Streptomyces sp. NBC_00868 TaxID=2903683 RepID=UPI002F90DB60|nr:Cof-type HAD-IIB family hydrolase [Streptomyces sp. NBC_00868]